MLFDIFVKFWVTPENVLGIVWSIVTIVGMCMVFHAWQEKWWKSLIPFYGTYLIYKNAWKERKWLFFVQMLFDLLSMISSKFMKKHLKNNLFAAIKTYIETETIDIDINVPYLLICVIILLISMFVVFLLARITYWQICDSLGIKSIILKVGTFIVPQVFLIVDYVYVKKQMRKNNDIGKKQL